MDRRGAISETVHKQFTRHGHPCSCKAVGMASGLAVNPCQDECSWHPTGEQPDGRPLFRCAGCASEWTPDQAWTPRNVDGEVPDEVLAAKR